LPLERHFHTVTLEPDEVAEGPVYHFVREHLTAEDWHLASRGISISKALTDRRAAPPLIEAMNIWLTRKEAGLQAARVLGEIEEQLVARSGLKLGQRPERWRTWWRSVKVGEVGLPADSPSAARTHADFFGLRPETDRVIFVLDRSGSMDADFRRSGTDAGRKQPTRFDEATAQLLRCVEDLGESARFDVILFSDRARRFRGELVTAQEKNLQSLAKWIRSNGPDGGTHLRPSIDMAMSREDPAALEADTIIVLCDGETVEGGAWVAPFIRSENDKARVRFHAVQLGGRSDGALEALCSHTDGDYVEVRDDR